MAYKKPTIEMLAAALGKHRKGGHVPIAGMQFVCCQDANVGDNVPQLWYRSDDRSIRATSGELAKLALDKGCSVASLKPPPRAKAGGPGKQPRQPETLAGAALRLIETRIDLPRQKASALRQKAAQLVRQAEACDAEVAEAQKLADTLRKQLPKAALGE